MPNGTTHQWVASVATGLVVYRHETKRDSNTPLPLVSAALAAVLGLRVKKLYDWGPEENWKKVIRYVSLIGAGAYLVHLCAGRNYVAVFAINRSVSGGGNMSNWAVIEKGREAISAWEYRAIFLKHGTTYDEFFCPFCDIRLAAVLVYTTGEISKSPHFSAKWKGHINGCDGEPILVDAPERKRPEAHYIPREMHFPEAFTDRPPPRKQKPAGVNKNLPPPTSLETSTRRRKAGSLGRPIPRAYLLQPIVEAYNSVWIDGFEQAKKEKWSDVSRLGWTTDCLATMPLRLEDPTNYHDAFRSPGYIHNKHPRIYHSAGTVSLKNGQYVIEGTFNLKKQGTQLLCRVVIETATVSGVSPKSHHALLSILESFADGNQEVRWYAYGKPKVSANDFSITIENLDYLYIKRAFPKKQP